jgi:hypothetical protein
MLRQLPDGELHLSRPGGLLNVIQRARQEIMELQRRRSASRLHQKLEDTESKVEIELFLDDLVAEGVDLKTPVGVAIAMCAWCLKKGEALPGADDWDETPSDLEF